MDEIDIRIRVATIEDRELILSFISQKANFDRYPQPLEITIDKLGQTLFAQPPLAQVLLAQINNVAVGFALFSYTYSSFLAQPTLWVSDLYVQPLMRGKGIGTALLQRLAQIAEEANCGRLEWTVADCNTRAIAFYKKHGTQVLDVRLCRIERSVISQLAGKQSDKKFTAFQK
ncbi:GNAT family N-acetyltransferase [Gloeocapsa sp. BRSZ]